MIRRLFLSLALIILFAIGQQGAVLHEISHLSIPANQLPSSIQQDTHQQDTSSHGSICDKCISYSQIASALDAQFVLPTLLALSFVLSAFLGKRFYNQTTSAYSARAPPRFSLI